MNGIAKTGATAARIEALLRLEMDPAEFCAELMDFSIIEGPDDWKVLIPPTVAVDHPECFVMLLRAILFLKRQPIVEENKAHFHNWIG